MKILLNTIEKVKNFVAEIDQFESDIDARVGRFCIDGHSIMGLFSLNLSQPLDVEILSPDADETERFYDVVSKYKIGE